MAGRQSDVQKMVDDYFTNHPGRWRCNEATAQTLLPCPPSCKSKPHTEKHQLTQKDVDALQLMNPRLSANQYMSSIIELHEKEESFRPREDNYEPMHLALSTRTRTHSPLPPKHQHQLGRMPDSHATQLQCDIGHQQHIKRLREMCYLGLGRMIIGRKQTRKKVQLTKANYHTRQYLLPHVKEEIQRLEHQQEQMQDQGQLHSSKYYLIADANSRGINFDVKKMPLKLSKVLEFAKYREIACTLNQIIQQTVYGHKKKIAGLKQTSRIFVWLPGILATVTTLLLVNQLQFSSTGLQISCLLISMAVMIFILMLTCHRFNQRIVYLSLVDQINRNITDYLDYLNSRPNAALYWKAPPHLYWIEISQAEHQRARGSRA